MKNLNYIFLFVSTSAFSFIGGGAGGIVTDPTSYTYYTTQIEQAIDQVKLAEKQLKEVTKSYEMLTSIDENITGNLQRAQNYAKKIKDLKELQNLSLGDIRRSLIYTTKALDEIAEIPQYQNDIADGIDDVFGEEQQERNDWVSVEAEKKRSKQKAYKQAIVDSEVAQGKVKLQLEQMEELALATNTAETMKDSTDVANAILLQMLDRQQEMIKILSNISKNVAIAYYDGKDIEKKSSIVDGKDLLKPSDWETKRNGKKAKTMSEMIENCNPLLNKCF